MTNTHITIGGHKVSAGKVYSTSEVRTGDVWTDGKPIYRKVTTFTTPNSSSTTNYGYGVSDIQTFVRGECYIDTGTNKVSVPFYAAASYAYIIWATTGFAIHVEDSSRQSKDAYVIIEYTKTTD